MSYPTHLICRDGYFYYRAKVPVDIQQHFPTNFITRSLKTTDLSVAKAMLINLEYAVQRVFTLLRTGMLDDDMASRLVNGIIPAREEVKPGVVRTLPKGSLTLSAAISQYMTLKEPEWTPKTMMEMTGVFRLLRELLGDIPIADITKATMLDLRAKLMKLPANRYKRFPDQAIHELLERQDVQPMSAKTVNKHVVGMGAVLRYFMDEGIIAANYASGLKISEKRRTDEERSCYTLLDLRLIFTNLPQDKATPERYWIPLIGCWSGMRLNEICQLYVEDVQEVEGVWCFSINDAKDKRLKTQTSERCVPIHPKLLDLGFLDHVEQMKSSGEPRLWMNLTWMDIHGYSNNFGKWYQRFNREYVTEDPKRVFHSFRHLVTDTLKQAGVQDSLIAELVGHSHGNHAMTMSRYGKRYQPKVLLEALQHLDYGIEIKRFDQ